MIRPCMGGRCHVRDSCVHYVKPTTRENPIERLCAPGREVLMGGYPVQIYRPAGAWERTLAGDLLLPAGPWDGLGQ